MSFIETIPYEKAEGDVRDMYDRQQAAYGYLPNYATVFCYQPNLMTAWANLQKEIKSSISHKHFELATFASARAMKNSYCSLAHGKVLLENYFSVDELCDIALKQDTPLTDLEKAIVAVSEKVVLDSSQITQSDLTTLKQLGLSDSEIFGVVAAAAARCFFGKLVDSLGALPDHGLSNLNEGLRELLVVGRPIEEG